jgi:hypothetical protein
MNRIKTILLICLVLHTTMVLAQPRQLKKILELKMPKGDDDFNNGQKGASVCWNPVTKKYYAAFALSKHYPLGVFDETGKLLTDTSLAAMQNVRGLWYNPSAKKICGNSGNDGGWFSYILNSKGVPVSCKIEIEGMKQPDENSTGAYDAASQLVYFFDKGKFSFYNNKAVFTKKLAIHFGQPKVLGPAEFENEDNENSDYNQTTVIYTGIPASPLGLLNVKRNRIELYDNKEGYLQQILLLPDDDMYGSRSLNFAYANGIYWLFNIFTRTWQGFK